MWARRWFKIPSREGWTTWHYFSRKSAVSRCCRELFIQCGQRQPGEPGEGERICRTCKALFRQRGGKQKRGRPVGTRLRGKAYTG